MTPIRIKLPATSANLGPAFDAAGLALSLHLTVEAEPAAVTSIRATGRNVAQVESLDGNLILEAFHATLSSAGRKLQHLKLHIQNEIPLGAGCGSSAAAILAGVALANHFGNLHLTDEQIVASGSKIEGHPDNIAACWLGGYTTSVQAEKAGGDVEVQTATFAGNPAWEMVLALQPAALATKQARALLPESYSRADAVFNIQRSSLLTAAFAQGRLDLLRTATQDALHQPYRAAACPLLGQLLPLAQEREIASVTLSGAGPSVLIVLAETTSFLEAETRIRSLVAQEVELLNVRIAGPTTITSL